MKLQTLLLVKFNIRFDHRFTYNNDPKWLSARFDLFEKYCFPSIIGQTSKDFSCVFFFDENTPDVFKQRVEGYKEVFPNINISYSAGVNAPDNGTTTFIPDIKDFDFVNLVNPFRDNSDYLLTVRLDNDDAIASTYIENLQNKVREIQSTPPPII